MQHKHLSFLVGCFFLAALSGCKWEPSRHVAASEPPAIPVSHPVEREVTDYVDFTGQLAAVESVDVRPRVTGYITRIYFREKGMEGKEIKAGTPLFQIDPEIYRAQLDQAESQVRLNEAALELARTTYERDRNIAATASGSVSQQQLAEDRGAVRMAEARLKASEASRNTFKINFDHTLVVAPIDGQVSRTYQTVGNLVNADQTVLTTIVSLDPMYAYFDLDEPTLLRLRRAIREGDIEPAEKRKMPVLMGLQGEEGYPHEGFIFFENNQINTGTGSITMGGQFDNPLPSRGKRLLSPGMFVRVRLPIGQPHRSLLVIDRAISSDQGIKYVYVLDADNNVQERRITTGALQMDGLRVINKGLKPDDWVVVGGLPQLRARMLVRPDYQKTMPILGRSVSTAAAEDSNDKKSSGPSKPATK